MVELIVDEKEQEEEGDPEVHKLRLNLNGDELKMWEYIVKNVETVSLRLTVEWDALQLPVLQ